MCASEQGHESQSTWLHGFRERFHRPLEASGGAEKHRDTIQPVRASEPPSREKRAPGSLIQDSFFPQGGKPPEPLHPGRIGPQTARLKSFGCGPTDSPAGLMLSASLSGIVVLPFQRGTFPGLLAPGCSLIAPVVGTSTAPITAR